MLEQLLWQLGLSPQMGNPGSEGARIGTVRFTDKNGRDVFTRTCDNELATLRNTYYSGWKGCPSGRVSMEAMVRRFQARNATSDTIDNHVNTTSLAAADGKVDTLFLSKLNRDWKLYWSAYSAFPFNSVISPIDDPVLMATWVNDAVAIWTNGIGARVPANTYSVDTHNAIIKLAGLTPSADTSRETFLRYWISKEASHHWGGNRKNYQETPYRMEEGGADEHGSLSFSQLLYGHRFGKTPCAAHADAGLNLYHPGDNAKTFVVHTASNNTAGGGQTRCKGMMYRGFHADDQTLDKTFSSDTGSINKRAGNVEDLRGYRHLTGTITAVPTNEDNYDVLAKAIMGYNGGEGFADDYSWAKYLKYKEYRENSNRNTGSICHSCRYSIEVREETFGAHLRTYIWRGGDGFDVNKDGEIQDIEDDSTTPEDESLVETTVPWCFEYGEKEWVNPEVDPLTKLPLDFNGYKNRARFSALNRITCN